MTSYFLNVFSKSINHHIQIPSLTDIDGYQSGLNLQWQRL